MAIFQSSVLKKYLKQQDKEGVSRAYKKFYKHFHNAHIQKNIRNAKEEQYQESFLRELFVDVVAFKFENTHVLRLSRMKYGRV